MMVLAVKAPQLPVNNMGHSEATKCLCIMFAMQRTKSSDATVNHMINTSSSQQGKTGCQVLIKWMKSRILKNYNKMSRMHLHHNFV